MYSAYPSNLYSCTLLNHQINTHALMYTIQASNEANTVIIFNTMSKILIHVLELITRSKWRQVHSTPSSGFMPG